MLNLLNRFGKDNQDVREFDLFKIADELRQVEEVLDITRLVINPSQVVSERFVEVLLVLAGLANHVADAGVRYDVHVLDLVQLRVRLVAFKFLGVVLLLHLRLLVVDVVELLNLVCFIQRF